MRIEKMNWQAHLQGMYIYEAICDASPILNPFAKKGTKPLPYPSVPYGATESTHVDKDAQTKKAMDIFSARVAQFNENFRKEIEDAGLGNP